MTGLIDEVRVWSTVRTADEIKANYQVLVPPIHFVLPSEPPHRRTFLKPFPTLSPLQRSIDMAADPDASDLNLYWRFDTPGGVADASHMIETDLSASGNHGLVGSLPTIDNVMKYVTDRGTVVPDAPVYMASSAPVVGGGEVVFPCACSGGNAGATTIALPAEDPDGDSIAINIASVPSFGRPWCESTVTTTGTSGKILRRRCT